MTDDAPYINVIAQLKAYEGISMLRLLSFLFLAIFSISAFGKGLTKQSKLKIIFLGDSITEGYGIERPKVNGFPALLQQKFKKKGYPNITIIGSGVAGDTSASGPGRLKWLFKFKPDVLVLELGANDGLRGHKITSTKANLRKTIQLAKANGLKVILLGMRLTPNFGKNFNDRFENIFTEIAKIERIGLIPFFFNKLQKNNPKKKLVLPDGLHPNEEGHRLIADQLYGDLLKLL